MYNPVPNSQKCSNYTPPPKNGVLEPSYIPTDWKYDTTISLVGGNWHQQHNAKIFFKLKYFCQDKTPDKMIEFGTLIPNTTKIK